MPIAMTATSAALRRTKVVADISFSCRSGRPGGDRHSTDPGIQRLLRSDRELFFRASSGRNSPTRAGSDGHDERAGTVGTGQGGEGMSDDIAEVTSAEPPDDAQLAAAFAAGDDGAFEALYRRCARPVHDYILGVVRNRSLAEDVTQNTFVRAYESRDALRDPAAFRGCLYRIAHNAAINQVTRAAPADELADDAPYASQNPGPEQLAEQDEAVRLVWDAAASLDPRQYAVLDLALRQGLSSAEIGTVLDLDNAQASLALHRAREALGNAVRYLVVARRRRHCDRLAELVPAGGRRLTPHQRATVDRHMRRCDDCRRVAQVLTAPGELFGLAPIAGLPLGLHEWRSWNAAAT